MPVAIHPDNMFIAVRDYRDGLITGAELMTRAELIAYRELPEIGPIGYIQEHIATTDRYIAKVILGLDNIE
jgi:hypothetical protein